MNSKASSLTSRSVRVTVYFPVLTGLFVGEAEGDHKEINHSPQTDLWLYWQYKCIPYLHQKWTTLTQRRLWRSSWTWPHPRLCQGGIWVTAHGIASWFLKAMHPRETHTISPQQKWSIYPIRKSFAAPDECLPGPSWGLHKGYTPGILCPAWTLCKLGAGTQPSRTTRQLFWKKGKAKQITNTHL